MLRRLWANPQKDIDNVVNHIAQKHVLCVYGSQILLEGLLIMADGSCHILWSQKQKEVGNMINMINPTKEAWDKRYKPTWI